MPSSAAGTKSTRKRRKVPLPPAGPRGNEPTGEDPPGRRVLSASWISWARSVKVILAGGIIDEVPISALLEVRRKPDLDVLLARVDEQGGGVEVVFTDGTWTDFGWDFAHRQGTPRRARSGRPGGERWRKVVGRRIKQHRTARGWTAGKLADESGIAQPNIVRLEQGRHEPRTSTLAKVARALRVPLEELLP